MSFYPDYFLFPSQIFQMTVCFVKDVMQLAKKMAKKHGPKTAILSVGNFGDQSLYNEFE